MTNKNNLCLNCEAYQAALTWMLLTVFTELYGAAIYAYHISYVTIMNKNYRLHLCIELSNSRNF